MEVSIGTNMMEHGPPWRMARDHLAPIAEAGARCIDLHMGARYGRAEGSAGFQRTRSFIEFHKPEHWRRIAAWLGELGLTAVCAHTSAMGTVDVSSPDETGRAYAVGEIRATARFCASLGVPVMVVHPDGSPSAGESREARWTQLRMSLDEVIPAAEESGVRIALENLLPGSIAADVGVLVSVVKSVDHPSIGVCLDTGHLNVMKGRPVDAVGEIGPKLFALHVHDNDGRSDQHLPPFDGRCDWSGFRSALESVGYRGTLNLEVLDCSSAQKGASPAFIEHAIAMARRLLSE